MRLDPLAAPHTTEELEHVYRDVQRPVERSRWPLPWLNSKAYSIPEIIQAAGYSRSTISVLISRYDTAGQEAVVDKRQLNKSDLALNSEQQELLFQALQEPPETDVS